MAVAEKPLYYLTIHEAQQLIRERKLSPVELTQAVLDRITAVDGKLHAYINLMADGAMTAARAAEAEIAKGNWRGPMHGIPFAVKDQLDVEGAPARVRQFTQGVGDATPVRKLREAGAVLMGKLHMSSMPGAELPLPRNPWNTDHITGGSSTGSGAAVAGGLCLGSLGEDTAGSIRNPSAFCGIAGLKATYGRVSRHGLAPLSWSLDHCGPMARAVEDLAHMLNALAGYDPKDPTSSAQPVVDYTSALREDVKGMVIGVPRDYIDECAPRTDPIVLNRVDEAIDQLKALGARIEDVKVPTLHLATIANAVIYYNEFWAAHRSDGSGGFEDRRGATARADLSRPVDQFLGLYSGAADPQPLPRRVRGGLSKSRLPGAAESKRTGAAGRGRRTHRHAVQACGAGVSRPVQLDRPADLVGALRFFAKAICPSRCKSSASRSMRSRCCAPAIPTSSR